MAKHLGTQKTWRFSDDELAILEAVKDKHGTYKAGLMAALRREVGSAAPTDAELLDMLKARLAASCSA